ncbi:hypothetical protein PHYPO_G00071520 [Pangasianodon hypophthalmus]|uniref:Uncharacterized protein n=1 Tax=Pangasianodon hypophthalmus TaxID=310915 RepID=A0A5N5LWC2_PANHP|nr:hypothetical protein PHYPO_G00071520 [Pangasianodon hypophthalmus]
MEYNLETSLTRSQGIKTEKPSLSFIFPVLLLHFLFLSPNVSTLSILSPTPVSDPTGCSSENLAFVGQLLVYRRSCCHPHPVQLLSIWAAAVSSSTTVPLIPECFAKAGKMEPNQLFYGFGPLQPAVAVH